MQTALQHKKFFESSFLSCEKDCELILQELFVNNKPYSDDLKRLLLIGTKDCLDNKTSEVYNKKMQMNLKQMTDEGYLRFSPKLDLNEHEEVKSYLHFVFDNIVPNNENNHYRDMSVFIDVICHTDYWDIGNYRLRPLKICGYIDAILNKNRLSGIGTFQFQGCSEIVLSENLSGYCMVYRAVHGDEDINKNDKWSLIL